MRVQSLMGAALATLIVSTAAFAHGGANYEIKSAIGGDQFCLDARGDQKADGVPVFMWKCHGHENQRWAITEDGNGQHAIIGTGGYCLDVRGRHARADGTPIQLWKCHFGSNQRFRITAAGQIQEVESGKCLLPLNEKDGAPVVLDTCLNTPVESWNFRH